jgi:hypothetical protein
MARFGPETLEASLNRVTWMLSVNFVLTLLIFALLP